MKLKEVSFVLENCEVIAIDGNDVGDIFVGDISDEICGGFCFGEIIKSTIAKRFHIELHKRADKKHLVHGLKSCATTVFKRLTDYLDITQIDLVLDTETDGELETLSYRVDWTGESDSENEAEKVYVSPFGHLYIVISAKETISDVFCLEAINDETDMKFHFDMLDVEPALELEEEETHESDCAGRTL